MIRYQMGAATDEVTSEREEVRAYIFFLSKVAILQTLILMHLVQGMSFRNVG